MKSNASCDLNGGEPHEWRLIKESEVVESAEVRAGESLDAFRARVQFYRTIVGYRRRWYCTHCRLVETTETET